MKKFKLIIGLAIVSAVLIMGCKKDKDSDPVSQNPAVASTSQQDHATGVPRNEAIAITFTKQMDASTFTTSTFSVKQGNTSVTGTVSYAGTTATFTPAASLEANTIYTATVTTGVKDATGISLSSNIVWSFTTAGSMSALATVPLATAGNYVILAKTAINNTPTSAITGNIGLSPAATSYITGFATIDATGYATSSQVSGMLYAADMASPTSVNLTTAVNDMNAAYNNAAARPSPDFLELGTGNIGGKTLTAGLYKWTGNVTVPSSIALSGGANDVWIFQIAGNLSMSSAINITLSGGAQAKNIFWQVAGTVTLGTTAHAEGVILSKTGITLATGASLNGRALAQTSVILDGNTVTQP